MGAPGLLQYGFMGVFGCVVGLWVVSGGEQWGLKSPTRTSNETTLAVLAVSKKSMAE